MLREIPLWLESVIIGVLGAIAAMGILAALDAVIWAIEWSLS